MWWRNKSSNEDTKRERSESTNSKTIHIVNKKITKNWSLDILSINIYLAISRSKFVILLFENLLFYGRSFPHTHKKKPTLSKWKIEYCVLVSYWLVSCYVVAVAFYTVLFLFLLFQTIKIWTWIWMYFLYEVFLVRW